MKRLLTVLFVLTLLFPAHVHADEGLWTLDNFPAAKVQATYGFSPGPQFLDHLREASVRLPGCSGSFVSKNGLIMSNHHCARGCIQNISSPQNDFLEKGFFAKTEAEEVKCPGFD